MATAEEIAMGQTFIDEELPGLVGNTQSSTLGDAISGLFTG